MESTRRRRTSAVDVLDALESAFADWPIGIDSNTRFAIALSGGLDSSFLLALMSKIALPGQLRALHVDHGLHADSERWQAFCVELCESFGVQLHSERIDLAASDGASLEAVAREARYSALASMLQPQEVLLTAHHADDQLETALFRLVRGAGVRGMCGIVDFSAFARGYLARPLLGFTRERIGTIAEEWELRWIEDPSNADTRFDRNYLRKEVTPAVRAHWPAAAHAAVRVGSAMRDAEEILLDMARIDARELDGLERVPCGLLRGLSPARQRNLLRYAIRELELPAPTARQLTELRNGLAVTRPDAKTQICWPGGEARVYRDHLYLFAPIERNTDRQAVGPLSPSKPWIGSIGELVLRPAAGIGLPDAWVREGLSVGFRHGGEMFQPLNRPHARPLKKWFQEAGIVPWMREWIPLIMRNESIVAVADIWLSDTVRTVSDERFWQVAWHAQPRLR